MIDFFNNYINYLRTNNASDFKIKQCICVGDYFYKFYAGKDQRIFLEEQDPHRLIKAINKCGNGLVTDYKVWEDLGAVYLKCKKATYHYKLNQKELINKFNTFDEYLIYCIENVIKVSKEIYPSHFNDFGGGNVAVQEDLSWSVVDLEDMFEIMEVCKKDWVNHISYRLTANLEMSINRDFDNVYAKKFILDYFKSNSHLLDFLPD